MQKTALFLVFSTLLGCTKVILPADNETIILQQPVTREVFYCESTPEITASACAINLEKNGFVRLTDKPTFPGRDDLIQKGSYPTRRYRDKQDIPRW